jgi:hypothetical protein
LASWVRDVVTQWRSYGSPLFLKVSSYQYRDDSTLYTDLPFGVLNRSMHLALAFTGTLHRLGPLENSSRYLYPPTFQSSPSSASAAETVPNFSRHLILRRCLRHDWPAQHSLSPKQPSSHIKITCPRK